MSIQASCGGGHAAGPGSLRRTADCMRHFADPHRCGAGVFGTTTALRLGSRGGGAFYQYAEMISNIVADDDFESARTCFSAGV